MPICIVGMHRSGTSLVARVLHEAGLYLGPDEEFMPANEGNPEGYWENLRFVELNDAVLAALGGAWDWPATFPPNWRRLRVFQTLLERAKALAERFADHEPWGWKDPRNTVTLPFWMEAVPELKFVVSLRNPLEVAESLVKRNPSGSLQAGYALWQVYYERILSQTRGRDRIVTRFDSYFEDFDAEFRRVLHFVGLPSGKRVLARCRSTVVADLRHHRMDADLAVAGVPDRVVRTYRLLCNGAARSRGGAPDARHLLDVLRYDLQREVEQLRQDLLDSRQQAEAQAAAAQALVAASEKRARELEELHATTLANLSDFQARTADLERVAAEQRADRDRWRELALRPGVIRPVARSVAAFMASLWSRVPDRARRVIRPLAWRIPGLQRLRRLERQVRLPDVPLEAPFADAQDPAKRLARLRVWDAVHGERTRIGILRCLLRLAAREPGTLARAVSLADVAKLVGRLRSPDASAGRLVPGTTESPLQLEARAVAERFSRPIELGAAKPFAFPRVDEPEVSIVIPVWNRWQLTYRCLAGIAENAKDLSYEVVVVDNGSTDETPQILEWIGNVRVVRNETNRGFLLATNQGARHARGKYLLFLNNDAHILSGTVSALLSTIRSDPTVGAVGGRIVFLTGRLQEAGSIVWSDGSCLGYGRGDDPFDPQYSFVRDVDFCSGALLLTPRELFVRLGLFDERYAPAYYEDADYCMSVRANGLRVVYQPRAVIVHHEFGSTPRREAAIEAQVRNQRVFVEKWASVLGTHVPPSLDSVLLARDATRRPRLLFVDDRVPDPRLGSGFPRTHRMLTSLRELGWAVTFFPLQDPERLEPCTSELQALGIEVITGPGGRKLDLKAFLERRSGRYDVVLISRPHNMKEVLPFARVAAPNSRIVYDAEAIYAQRELQLLRLQGLTVSDEVARAMMRDEVSLVAPADAVTAVSSREARTFADFGARSTHVVGHLVERRPTSTPFHERADLLFVGSILVSPSPNEDAVLYFVREILPLIRRRLRCTLFVVGMNRSRAVSALDSAGVRIVGTVDDLTPWYSRVRAFVVPARYAAGIPIKLYDASAYGLPSVVTPLIAEQVGWSDGREVLVGSDPEEFARRVVELYSDETLWEHLRSAALSAVGRDCSKEVFLASLRAATETCRGSVVARPVARGVQPARADLADAHVQNVLVQGAK